MDREQRRLDALASYQLLDTPKETEFDEVAQLAAEICDAPIAVVNLIAADRQFFKAEVGLGVRETPLETSFCAHAILEDDFLEVGDATTDRRFSGNPLVTAEGGLRFYAGQLLKTRDGLPIGTLCVLDTRPRVLEPLQRRALQVLGRQVMSQIELRRAILLQDDVAKRRQLVQQETNHRLKNTMTMVQAIATQTLRKETSPKALAAFQARLQSLAVAQDVLQRENWTAATLVSVLREVVANAGQGERISLEGPPVELGARAAFSASLVAHELTTNATKYGALSTPGGRVEVRWDVVDGRLELWWREFGGPAPTPPSRQGFGSKLINMGLVGSGRVEVRYPTTGFQAILTASLQDLRLS